MQQNEMYIEFLVGGVPDATVQISWSGGGWGVGAAPPSAKKRASSLPYQANIKQADEPHAMVERVLPLLIFTLGLLTTGMQATSPS